MRCWIFRREQIRTHEHVAVAVSELRAETRLAALEGRIKAPRPGRQSAYLCGSVLAGL